MHEASVMYAERLSMLCVFFLVYCIIEWVHLAFVSSSSVSSRQFGHDLSFGYFRTCFGSFYLFLMDVVRLVIFMYTISF
jgi:hypothetical protein